MCPSSVAQSLQLQVTLHRKNRVSLDVTGGREDSMYGSVHSG